MLSLQPLSAPSTGCELLTGEELVGQTDTYLFFKFAHGKEIVLTRFFNQTELLLFYLLQLFIVSFEIVKLVLVLLQADTLVTYSFPFSANFFVSLYIISQYCHPCSVLYYYLWPACSSNPHSGELFKHFKATTCRISVVVV